MSNVIQWRQGYRAYTDVTKVHAELEKIRKEHGDINIPAVVEKAKAKRNPMHKEVYTEDDEGAAHKWRMERARRMVSAVQIIHQKAPDAPATRAYSVVTKPSEDDEPPKRVYQSTEEALRDPVQRDEILGNAIRDALTYRRKYQALQELSQVFTAMDDFVSKFKV